MAITDSTAVGTPTTPGTIADYWREMVTVALLGTDRREPPSPPAGALADLAADDPQPTPSQRLLQQVAGCIVAQRAGMLPGRSATLVASPGNDPRPVTPPSATATWHRLVDDWAVLEDEWVLAVIHSGRRLAPELVVPVLSRYRTDATRHARALVAAGPLGQWMIEWSPRLACAAKKPAVMEAIGELPELVIIPELQAVLWAAPQHAAHTIVAGLSSGALGTSHRAVLVNLVARVQPASLPVLAEAIGNIDPSQPTIGLAFALADLARLRHQMLTELEPT
ncbi:MAG: hypothetical protein QOJ74_1414 [Ilumatobacteraceae bacterium]|jgi:hypothetical protein|nr:hypothetical protein [Ilumatobacteraceae bacterium]